MNRLQRSGVVCAIVGLGIGVLMYVVTLGSKASVNGVERSTQASMFPPVTLVLLGVGVVLFLLGWLKRDKES